MKEVRREVFMAKRPAMKKVLSPISDRKIREKAEKRGVGVRKGGLSGVGHGKKLTLGESSRPERREDPIRVKS
jgi:hypothetical protein